MCVRACVCVCVCRHIWMTTLQRSLRVAGQQRGRDVVCCLCGVCMCVCNMCVCMYICMYVGV